MKKNLPDLEIVNELSGSSVFFSSQKKVEAGKSPMPSSEAEAATNLERSPADIAEKPRLSKPTPSSNHDTVTPRNRETKKSNNQAQMVEQSPSTMRSTGSARDIPPDLLEDVRKVVKQLGKEAATHRFTLEEKRAIGDLVYTYQRQGYRTSENEITRIAVNWLLSDFKERGEQSVLARMLELLHG